jgi:hypothetical protein
MPTLTEIATAKQNLAILSEAYRQVSERIIWMEGFNYGGNYGQVAQTEFGIERLRKQQRHIWGEISAVEAYLSGVLESPGYERLYDAGELSAGKITLISEVSSALMAYLATHPEYLYRLHSRTFENIVARVFADFGYDVQVTRATHDGGKDIILTTETPMGSILAFVECKRYAPSRRVGVEVVQRLHGVQLAEHASKSIIVTTSRFSKEAEKFASRFSFLISLRDYDDVVGWLSHYK